MGTASGREEPCERPAETEAVSEEGCAEDAEGKASGEKSQEEGRRQLRSLTPVGRSGRCRVPLALSPRRLGLALLRRKLDLPQADALRRHLDALVVPDELERLLQRQ